MLEGLLAAHRRYDELSAQLSQPDAASDIGRYRALMKEYKELEPLSRQYLALAAAEEALAEAKELLYSHDAELSAMAAEQKAEAEEEITRLTEEARLMLLPHDPRDDRSVIMELRAGTGGEEAALFAADLYRMYNLYAAARGWRVELMNAGETELGGYREIVFSIEGEKVFSRLKFESGIHRVQQVPVTDSQGKIQTSAVTVAVLPEADEVEIRIDPKDLKIDTFRSSGAGGQQVFHIVDAAQLNLLAGQDRRHNAVLGIAERVVALAQERAPVGLVQAGEPDLLALAIALHGAGGQRGRAASGRAGCCAWRRCTPAYPCGGRGGWGSRS